MVRVADLALARRGRRQRRDLRAADSREPDRDDGRGLHPHCARQGAARAHCRPAPRGARGDQSGRDGPRRRHRRAAGQLGARRNGLQHPRDRATQLHRDHARRLPDRAGDGAVRGPGHHRGEHHRRHRLCVPRSEGALLVSASEALGAPSAAGLGEPLLRVEDLRVQFATDDGIVHAVDGITYQVHRGRTLGIVGESGSGKTVASLTTLGLTRQQGAHISGRILFEGRDLVGLPDEQLRAIRGNEIAMVFQDPLSSLHPLFRVGAQLIEAVLAHRSVSRAQARERAIELLGLVGIPDPAGRVDNYPHEFSGGMRQRAMIAMALANEPKLLIADEPTTALDVTVQAQILALIERLQRELNMAIVIITHDLGVVAEMADDIAVMYAGRIVETAPGSVMFAGPEHPYTWGLLKSIPMLSGPRAQSLVPIPGTPPSLIRRPSGCHFHPRCPYAQPDHARIDPALEPVPGKDDHHVACLLDAADRKRLWAELQAGRMPDQALAATGLGGARP
ncbi:MAG: ABC transporter ATP-binding protein [Actinobacteria bacterium]|nr:MAG: ABC transporter ATP-binding protein [Actinomycetota bacterium]